MHLFIYLSFFFFKFSIKSSLMCRLQGDHGKTECETPEDDEVDIKNTENEENFEPHLLNIPFDVLKMIMEFCVGVEYIP